MKAHPKLIATTITAALLAGAVYAAENAGGGQPTSTPTWTVPVAPSSNITIKQKSSNLREEKQSTNEICPPKCGPLGPSPTIPPAPQADKARGGKPIGRPMECRTPPCPGEPDPSKEESFKTTLVCCCEGKAFDNTKYKCNEFGKLVKRNPLD